MSLLERIREHARSTPYRPALAWAGGELGYADLVREVEALAARLQSRRIRTLGLALDNGPAWAAADLAALEAGIGLVALPPFFSPGQVRHCLEQAQVQAVLTDDPAALAARADGALAPRAPEPVVAGGRHLQLVAVRGDGGALPAGVAKVTYTSGTTGDPKGVMLAWSHLEPVVRSLVAAAEVTPADRLIALMPLAVLLENVGTLYAALWAGATAVLPGLAETGVRGAAGLDPERMRLALQTHRATTAILTPQTLQGLVERLDAGAVRPPDLRFAAVGGAPVAPRLLGRAAALGLPVYEGYGLSECGSVVCLNTRGANRPGSVGRPLPHVRVTLAADGEVVVQGQAFAGYLGQAPLDRAGGDGWPTGDLGRVDEDGFLYLTGRRRNVFITAYGRNVAPEWVERELTLEPAVAQAAVFGEARPWNVAIIVPATGADAPAVAAAVRRANLGLPDYARVSHWLLADAPFTPANGLLTGTGRVRREAVQDCYRDRIESLYRQEIAS